MSVREKATELFCDLDARNQRIILNLMKEMVRQQTRGKVLEFSEQVSPSERET